MKKVYNYLIILAAVLLGSSCNNEWEDEQYEQYVSFKAPFNDKGYTEIYVQYKEGGKVTYRLPLIVSGSNMNNKDLTVQVAVDPDTLKIMNKERFSTRSELYYKELPSKYYSFPETSEIKAGECGGLVNIDFTLGDLNLVEKWILPLTIVDNPSNDYQPNVRKHYRKAMLRVIPFNDYSGSYSTTAMKTYFYKEPTQDSKGDTEGDPMVANSRTAYVVNDNTIFFYAGLMDEDLVEREKYKVYVTFNEDKSLTLRGQDGIDFKVPEGSTPIYSTTKSQDATRPYIEHHYVTLRLTYMFNDITSAPVPIRYKVTGTLMLDRVINTQKPIEDQVEW